MTEMRQVFSSHINRVGYDDAAGELLVEYKRGKTSVYEGVPPGVAASVLGAPSIGEAVHGLLKGSYKHRYLEG